MGRLKTSELYIYWACQFLGAIVGVLITHILFGLEIIQESSKARDGFGIWTSEFISTLILLGVIYIGDKLAKEKIARGKSKWLIYIRFIPRPADSPKRY